MKRNEFISAVRMQTNITLLARHNLSVWANHARSFVLFDDNEGDYTPADLHASAISMVDVASANSKETFSKIYPLLDELIKPNDILEIVLKDGFTFPIPADAISLEKGKSEEVLQTAKLIALSILEQKLRKTLKEIEPLQDVQEMKSAIGHLGIETLGMTDYLAWSISSVPDYIDMLVHKKIDDPQVFLAQYKNIVETLSRELDVSFIHQ